MPTVTVICIWLSLPGYRLAERRVCHRCENNEENNYENKISMGKEFSQKNTLKVHRFIPHHTNCLFCPWPQQQSLLFTKVIATGMCACRQSIGGFGRKAATSFGENCVVGLYNSDDGECSRPRFVTFSTTASVLKDTRSIFRQGFCFNLA